MMPVFPNTAPVQSARFARKMLDGLVAGLIACLMAANGWAQDVAGVPAPIAGTADNTLHILRPIVHAEQEDAELCLEFDRNLGSGNYGRIAANIHLESGGKNHPLNARNISITNNLLCIAPLEHHRDYHFSLNAIKTAKGEKLPEPYSLTFTVPDRQPALAFIADRGVEGVWRWQDADPVLRTINIPTAHVELYRIIDPVKMVEAWRQRRQASLVPTESAYFARQNGQLIWQGDVTQSHHLNQAMTQPLALHTNAGDQPNGLYLVIASMPDADAAKLTRTDKTKKDVLAPLTAEWLLRSDLRVQAYVAGAMVYGVTDQADGSALAADTGLTLYGAGEKIIAAGRSGADGIAALPVADSKSLNSSILLAQAADGAIDFAEPAADKPLAAPPPPAQLTLDKNFYLPDESVKATFAAYDVQGNALAMPLATLKLLWPDHNIFAALPAEPGKVEFAAPAQNGVWSLAWQKNDGALLAQAPLRVSSNAAAPYFTIAADHPMLAESGDATLTIKSLSFSGVPQPYLTGRITGAWSVPEHPFADAADYHFGGDNDARAAAWSAKFITDDKGIAVLHARLSPPDSPFLQALALDIQGGASSGAAGSPPFNLLVKPQGDVVIGIKPLRSGARFAENSVARFSLIALDGDGKRRAATDLSYQIFEDGRSFDWYQSEGHWAYKPLPQQRSLGGGALAIAADRDAVIEWPVTAGSYHLDIIDSDGQVIARTNFSAGWSAAETADAGLRKLALAAEPAFVAAGQPTRLSFTLDRPSAVTVIIADAQIRQLIHQNFAAGDHSISFTPQADWSHNLLIAAAAPAMNAQGTLLLGDPKTSSPATAAAVADPLPAPKNAEAVTISAQIPAEIRVGDRLLATITLKNNLPKTRENAAGFHYVFSAAPGLMLEGAAPTGILVPGAAVDVPLKLTALQAGNFDLRLDLTGTHNVRINRHWTINAMTRDDALAAAIQQTLAPQQVWAVPAKAAAAPPPVMLVAGQPMTGLPETLTAYLAANPFTGAELAQSLEVFRRWHNLMTAAGMLSEPAWQAHQRDLLLRLLQRQNTDGSFAALPHGAGDVASTAAAVTALAHSDDPIARPALTAAADWLDKMLENNWFEEKERPARAAAYAALAEADRQNIASLYYFADSSLDKNLPPVAAAQLAAAFAKIKDRAKTIIWLQATRPELDKDAPDAALLALLAANPVVDLPDILPVLQRSTPRLIHDAATNINGAADFLLAEAAIQNRAAWHLKINEDNHTGQGVSVYRLDRGVVQNTGSAPLFVMTLREASAPPATAVTIINRHVYRMNGTLLLDRQAFDRDATYAIVLDGENPADGDRPLFLRDDVNPLIAPITCALEPGLMTSDALNWLRALPPSGIEACEISPRAIDVALQPSAKGTPWRVVYLAKAKASGFFRFSPPTLR